MFTLFVSLYQELLEHTFLACLIVLDNLCEVFGFCTATNFISAIYGF